jgi:hypothetical protein
MSRIEIENFPAIKEHLDNYFDKIQKRDDQWDTPYNLRSCAYWEDFSKQKIVWNRIASEKQFALVENWVFIADSMHFITWDNLEYICCLLNSKIIQWLLYLIIWEAVGWNAWNADNIKTIALPKLNTNVKQKIENLLKNKDYETIDKLVCEIYWLTDEEIKFISSSVKS